MRGHIGFKTPKKPYPGIFLTTERVNVLTYQQPAPEIRLTTERVNVLTYQQPAPEIRLTAARTNALTIKPAPPSTPYDVEGVGDINSVLLLVPPVISNGLPINEYVVQYATTETNWTTVTINASSAQPISATSLSAGVKFFVPGLTPLVPYVFRVAARNNLGISPFSATTEQIIPLAPAMGRATGALDLVNWWADVTVPRSKTRTKLRGRNYDHYTVFAFDYPADANNALSLFNLSVSMFPDSLASEDFEDVACQNGVNGEIDNGANISDCRYTYDFQFQEVGQNPFTWQPVVTPYYPLIFQGESANYSFPFAPHVYNAIRPELLNLSYNPPEAFTPFAVGKTYKFRCLVTRKTTNAQFFVYNPYMKISIASANDY